jgi:hypothetical protein
MSNLAVAIIVFLSTVAAVAQGTINFNNRIPGTLVTHIYGPTSSDPTIRMVGNGSNDLPAGTTDWTGFTPIGAGGTGGWYGGGNTFAQLLAAPGSDQPETSLIPASPITTFRTGAAGGYLTATTATLANVPPDAPVATVEMVVWDNSSGSYPTWDMARTAWWAGAISAGKSGSFNVFSIGGVSNPTAILTGLQSFNIAYFSFSPEPSTVVLVLFGATTLLALRRSN